MDTTYPSVILGENEKIIGIYGSFERVNDHISKIDSLGFIAKTKTLPASFKIFIKTEIRGRPPINLEAKPSDTIENIKAMLQKKGLHPSQQTLIFNSKVLRDDLTLSDYKI